MNNMKSKSLLVTATIILLCVTAVGETKLQSDLVPDEATAVAVAEAILFRIYGKKNIEAERPYKITLTDGEWYIFGSPPVDASGGPVFGGAFHIVISQKDARVRSVGHEE